MNKYEAMFVVKPDLTQEEQKNLFKQIEDAVVKNKGVVSSGALWGERRKLIFPIKKQQEGVYYLLNFQLDPQALKELNHAYSLNENILRVLITRV